MKLHLRIFSSAFSPSFLLFGISVRREIPPTCLFNHNLKCFLSTSAAHQLFDESYHPYKFHSTSSSPRASNLHPAKVTSAHLQNPIREKISGKLSTKYALCAALSSCAKALNHCLGVQIHCLVISNGHENNLFLNSALVDLYGKCGVIEDARRVFDSMEHHDQVSWSAIISGYGRKGCSVEAISLFKQMLATDVTPNSFTYVSVINSCVVAKTELGQGALLHAHVVKLGFDTNKFVASTLIDYYSECGEMGKAASILNSTEECDDVIYNSMISGYSRNLQYEEAMKLFSEMRHSELSPTDYTLSIILSACGFKMKLVLGKQMHCLVIKAGLLCNLFVGCALINMYSRCGSIDEACAIFDQTVEKNIILYTAMMLGYAEHGRALEALKLFDRLMTEGRFAADHVCFMALLTACNHAGLLDEGISYFNKIKDCGLAPDVEHYACLVDLLARKGHIEKANQLMKEMPFHTNNVVLSSLMSSCRSYGATKPGIEAATQLISSQPDGVSSYLTLAQIYADAGLWDKVAYFKKLMEERGTRTRDGCSWIELYMN